MNVKVEVRTADNPVFKHARSQNILFVEDIFPLEMTGFAHAHHGTRADDVAVLKSRNEFAQIRYNRRHLRTADQFGSRQIFGGGTVDFGTVGHVAGDNPRQSGTVDQNMSCRIRNVFLGECLKFPFRRFVSRFKRAEEDCAVGIHAADLEHQRTRLHLSVRFSSFIIRHTGKRRNVAVARPVDENLRGEDTASALAFGNHAGNAVSVHDYTADERIQQNGHARVAEHIKIHDFELFGINGRGDFAFLRTLVAVGHRLQQFGIEFAVNASGKMAHQTGRGNPADGVVPFEKKHFCAAPSRIDGGRHAGRSGTRDDHVVFSGNRQVPRGFVNEFFHNFLQKHLAIFQFQYIIKTWDGKCLI